MTKFGVSDLDDNRTNMCVKMRSQVIGMEEIKRKRIKDETKRGLNWTCPITL